MADGLLFDNGTNVGIGTTTPSRRLTVVNPFSIGIAELSGNPTANTSIGIGRTDVEGTLNVAGDTNEFAAVHYLETLYLEQKSNTQRLILNSGNGAAALTILNGNTGIGTSSPTQN
ncbi:MAG: hypothetical protein IPL23_22835 [Saprospiraceae bacterium]|nr:hypothetical protein [Saprospiraceae bacterium]